MNLTNEELKMISAGSISWAVVGAVVAAGAFLVGVIDGYLRPYKCR